MLLDNKNKNKVIDELADDTHESQVCTNTRERVCDGGHLEDTPARDLLADLNDSAVQAGAEAAIMSWDIIPADGNDEATDPVPGGEARDIPLEKIKPSPDNPRKHFDPAIIQALAVNIRKVGLLQPVVVRKIDVPNVQPHGTTYSHYYEIVDGERRFRACTIVGLSPVPCRLVKATDEEALEAALISNLQREDLTPLEEAGAFARLMEGGMTQSRLAEKIGKSQDRVSRRVGLLRLPPAVQDMIEEKRLLVSHGERLQTWASQPAVCEAIALRCANEGWAVSRLDGSGGAEVAAIIAEVTGVQPLDFNDEASEAEDAEEDSLQTSIYDIPQVTDPLPVPEPSAPAATAATAPEPEAVSKTLKTLREIRFDLLLRLGSTDPSIVVDADEIEGQDSHVQTKWQIYQSGLRGDAPEWAKPGRFHIPVGPDALDHRVDYEPGESGRDHFEFRGPTNGISETGYRSEFFVRDPSFPAPLEQAQSIADHDYSQTAWGKKRLKSADVVTQATDAPMPEAESSSEQAPKETVDAVDFGLPLSAEDPVRVGDLIRAGQYTLYIVRDIKESSENEGALNFVCVPAMNQGRNVDRYLNGYRYVGDRLLGRQQAPGTTGYSYNGGGRNGDGYDEIFLIERGAGQPPSQPLPSPLEETPEIVTTPVPVANPEPTLAVPEGAPSFVSPTKAGADLAPMGLPGVIQALETTVAYWNACTREVNLRRVEVALATLRAIAMSPAASDQGLVTPDALKVLTAFNKRRNDTHGKEDQINLPEHLEILIFTRAAAAGIDTDAVIGGES